MPKWWGGDVLTFQPPSFPVFFVRQLQEEPVLKHPKLETQAYWAGKGWSSDPDWCSNPSQTYQSTSLTFEQAWEPKIEIRNRLSMTKYINQSHPNLEISELDVLEKVRNVKVKNIKFWHFRVWKDSMVTIVNPGPGIWRTSRSDGGHRSWGRGRGHRRGGGQGTLWWFNVVTLWWIYSTSEMLIF